MKRTIAMIALIAGPAAVLAGCATVPGGRAAGGVTMVESGVPRAVIVTGANPPETVGFAARELQAFVKKMSGAELPIAEAAGPGARAVRLGPAALEKLGRRALAGVERDGYLITESGGDLCIVGIDDAGPHTDIEALIEKRVTHDVSAWNFHRGTLYGVYRLLEELGMRWFMPGDFGERVPLKPTMVFTGHIRENPHFITRTVSYWSMWAGGHFNKNMQAITIMPGERDAIGFSPAENRLWELRMRGESFRIPLNHNPSRMRWSERFGETHPEYLALLPDGTRASGRHEHLCYTDPGMIAENIKDIKAWAAGRDAHERGIMSDFPYNRNWSFDIALGNYYSLLPQDGFRQCTCPGCQAKVTDDLVLVRQRHSKLVWDFVARVARETPGTNITCLAYGSYAIPYPGMKKLPPNVVVGFTAYTHPASLYYGNLFERYEKLLGEWAALSTGKMAYWQHYLASNRSEETVGMPEHTPEMYARVARTMAPHGNHVFCEMTVNSIMFQLFNRYLLLKLFYNPALDENELFRDYVTTFYGPDAGPVIADIYGDIGRLNVEKIRRQAGRLEYWRDYYTAEVLAAWRARADAALAKVAGTRYEPATAAFRDYYLGLVERGRAHFLATAGEALTVPNPEISSRHGEPAPVLDGNLDEPAWAAAETVILYDVDTGEPAVRRTEVRSVYGDDFVYFGVVAHDPGAAALRRVTGEPGEVDGIEIFLDTEHNKEGYYQMTFDLAGRLDERHYPDRIEPARVDWRSRARWATRIHDDRFVIEIALPRASLEAAGTDLAGRTWGVLVGRTVGALETGQGRFSSTSRILRRGFHQPALFNTLRFNE